MPTSTPTQQLTDVETLINQGANVLILLAQDDQADPAGASRRPRQRGIPVIAYDRLIEDPNVLYITFDNVGVGAAEADGDVREGAEGTTS